MTEIALLLCILVVLLYKARNYVISPELYSEPVPKLKIYWIITSVFYILFISAAITFIFLSLSNPHGRWDAWAIWNMRARFIFLSGNQLMDAFSSHLFWFHTDYPLLIPGIIARGWSYIGADIQIIPIILSVLFTFAIVGLISSSLSILRSKSQGFLSGIVLLGTPFFIKQGTWQYADIPLSFFFLATFILFCFQDRLSKNNYNFLFLAGMMAGFSAWTKNEGLLFLVTIILARFVAVVLAYGWKAYIRQMLSFSMGFMPILAIIIYFKTQIALPNDILYYQGLQITIDKLIDLSRYTQIFNSFVKEIISFGDWSVSIVFLLTIYLLFLGIKIEKDSLSIATIIITLCLMLAGYFFIYVITPYDLNWHLRSSLKRLFLQLWPSFVFVYFMIVRSLESTMRQQDQ